MESKESTELAPLSKRTIQVRNKAEAVHRLKLAANDLLTLNSTWVAEKREELDRATEAYKALQGTGASETRLRYGRHRVAFLRKVVNCLEEGFIPIPSFEGDKVNIDVRRFPLKALTAINDANATGLFDEIRFVSGQEAARGTMWGSKQKDPLLVGVVKIPQVTGQGNRWDRSVEITYPAIEQHFLLCWWAPFNEYEGDLF